MKIIIIGLGNFGSALAVQLTAKGHEVIGVDQSLHKAEQFKEGITSTVALDCTDSVALSTLPLKEADIVIVSIGEDFGASVMATAILKQLKVGKIVSRAMSPLHRTVLEAIGVHDIINPEYDAADWYAKKLELSGISDYFDLSDTIKIISIPAPEAYQDISTKDAGFGERYSLELLGVRREEPRHGLLHMLPPKSEYFKSPSPDFILKKGDVLVLMGTFENIRDFLDLG
jgi:trk system potassium uptake protein